MATYDELNSYVNARFHTMESYVREADQVVEDLIEKVRSRMQIPKSYYDGRFKQNRYRHLDDERASQDGTFILRGWVPYNSKQVYFTYRLEFENLDVVFNFSLKKIREGQWKFSTRPYERPMVRHEGDFLESDTASEDLIDQLVEHILASVKDHANRRYGNDPGPQTSKVEVLVNGERVGSQG